MATPDALSTNDVPSPREPESPPEQRASFARPRRRAPRDTPRHSVWSLALRRVWYRVQNDPLDIMAGGVALFGVLSLMPALAALVSIYGLVSSPADIHDQVAPMARVVPPAVVSLLVDQLGHAARSSDETLGLATAFSLGIALFSAAGGIRALMTALNLAHNQPEKRSWFRRAWISLGLAVGGILTVVVAVGLVVLLPTALHVVNLDGHTEDLINVGRWPALFCLVMLGLSVLYRRGPVDPPERIMFGALVATVLWMLSSFLLSLYVDRVANYSGLYGAFGGVLVLILWFYVGAFVVLLGAVINEELAEARWRRGSARARPHPRPARHIHAV